MRLTLLFAALLSSLSLFAQTTDSSYPASEPNLEKVKSPKEVQSLEEQQQQQLEEQQRMEEKENKKIEAIKQQNEELDKQQVIDNSLPASTPP